MSLVISEVVRKSRVVTAPVFLRLWQGQRVLGSQGDAAEQDEEEDQVGEDGVVDDAMAL